MKDTDGTVFLLGSIAAIFLILAIVWVIVTECIEKEKDLKAKSCNTGKCNFFLWGIVIILLGGIFFSQIKYFQIEDNYVGLVLGFIGVLATFIVVSNYAQLQEIKKDAEKKIEKNKKKLEQTFILHTKDIKSEMASYVNYRFAISYEHISHISDKLNFKSVIFDCYITAIYCLNDVSSIKTETINFLFKGLSESIKGTDAESIVALYKSVDTKRNTFCIDLLQKSNIDEDKNRVKEVIEFIRDINKKATEMGKESSDIPDFV